MDKVEIKDLIDSGVHFGHLTRKWNPNMSSYIYSEKNGIHIINLYKTSAKLKEACEALKKIASSGRKILFVATKKQAKDIVSGLMKDINMPFITERWPGGMLTNFVTIRKAVKKMTSIDRMKKDGTFETLSKKERLQVDRNIAKLEKKDCGNPPPHVVYLPFHFWRSGAQDATELVFSERQHFGSLHMQLLPLKQFFISTPY